MLRCAAVRAVSARAAHRGIGTSQQCRRRRTNGKDGTPALPAGSAGAASEPVPTVFSTLVSLFGGIAVVGALATANGADLEEVRDSMYPYGLDVARAAVCWPSNLLFIAAMAPSRYESKLWDLKHALAKALPTASDPATTTATLTGATELVQDLPKVPAPATTATPSATALAGELKDFQVRYGPTLTSARFDAALKYMLEPRPGSSVLRCDESGKYMYYLRACVDWELIRVQPMRYVWNETETLALSALLFTVGGAAKLLATLPTESASLSKLGNLTHTQRYFWAGFTSFSPLGKLAAGLPFSSRLMAVMQSVQHEPVGVRAAAIAGGVVWQVVKYIRHLAPLFVWANTLNLGIQFGTYKRP
jgi:hypothetical protein